MWQRNFVGGREMGGIYKRQLGFQWWDLDIGDEKEQGACR